jgi:hypothetical protein
MSTISMFKLRLKNNGGYITEQMYPDAITELGENYEVVVKQWSGNRYVVALKDLYKNMDEDDGIKEVFITAGQYDMMFEDKK